MNVAFDKWIPVVTIEGKPELASLCEVLTQGYRFADLAVRPHERVALMRLFLCVAHAALDGPKNLDEWSKVPERLPDAAHKYLEIWKDSFELFHPKKPWLQVAGLKKTLGGTTPEGEDWTPVSKLGFFMATGANTTLFDHDGMNNVSRRISVEATLLSMVTFQCFSPGGLISQVFWDGTQTGKSSKDAPCVSASMIHALIRSDNLAKTIHQNLPTFEDICFSYGEREIGRPIWENPPLSFGDLQKIEMATKTYVGRLVPMARFIRLHPDGQRMLFGDGLSYPPFTDGFPPEPTSTTVIRPNGKKQERTLLSYRPTKALWRELGALVVNRTADGPGGPLSLRSLPDGRGCDLVVAALARDQATIVDTTESVFHIPAHLRSSEGVAVFGSEVQCAEGRASQLGWAAETYREFIDGGWEGRLKGAGPSKGELRGKLHSAALMFYWTGVEKNLGILMAHIEAIGTDQVEPTRDAWHKMLFTTACDAYRTVCGQETPRQMHAFALGWQHLFSKPKAKESKIQEQEVEA